MMKRFRPAVAEGVKVAARTFEADGVSRILNGERSFGFPPAGARPVTSPTSNSRPPDGTGATGSPPVMRRAKL